MPRPAARLLTALAALAGAAALGSACQPAAPCECVCKCEGEAAAEAPKPASATPAPAAEAPKPAPEAPRLAATPATRATGQVAFEPGTGKPTDLPAAEREQMQKSFLAFLKVAAPGRLDAMKPFMTERLGNAVEASIPRHGDRFFRGLEATIAAAADGRAELKELRDGGGGNVEAWFVLGGGHDRRVVFFKEGGEWRLNRL